MTWTPPGNRNNQHIARWRAELYPLPKQDKTGILTRHTRKANRVLSTVRFVYRAGDRVLVDGFDEPGRVLSAEYNYGGKEYRVQLDNGRKVWTPERYRNGNLRVHSLMLAVA